MKNSNKILFLQEGMFGRRNTNLNRLWKFQYIIIDMLHLEILNIPQLWIPVNAYPSPLEK